MSRKSNRAKRTLPRYCHHKASGQAYVRLTEDGKRRTVYLGPHNSRESLEQYDKVVGDWLAKRPIIQDNVLRIRDVAERFKSYREPLLTDDKKHHLNPAIKLLIEHFGERPADDFDAMQLERFKGELVDAEYSRKYGNAIIKTVKDTFKWAAQRKLIPVENYTLIETVDLLTTSEAKTKVVTPIDDATVEQTLPELSTELQQMIAFIRHTGCRPGEARTMKVGDIDRETWLADLKQHKTAKKGKARYIVIPPNVREMLLPRLLRPADKCVFSSELKGTRPYEKRALGRAIDRAIKRINRKRKEQGEPQLEHWHPYQLRHTRATEAREQYSAEVCQVLLGHSKIDMTQHYAQLTKSKALDLSKQLG